MKISKEGEPCLGEPFRMKATECNASDVVTWQVINGAAIIMDTAGNPTTTGFEVNIVMQTELAQVKAWCCPPGVSPPA